MGQLPRDKGAAGVRSTKKRIGGLLLELAVLVRGPARGLNVTRLVDIAPERALGAHRLFKTGGSSNLIPSATTPPLGALLLARLGDAEEEEERGREGGIDTWARNRG